MRLKREKVDYSLFLVAFFITAKGNTITVSNLTFVLGAFVTLYFFKHRGYYFDKAFVLFSIVYFLILAIYIYKFGYLDPRTGREYLKFLYAYILIKMLWDKFIPYFTQTVYILAFISLPLYALQLYDYDMMKFIIGFVENNVPMLDYRDGWYDNNFIFTLNDNGMFRNSGFAWEPKGFGTFLVLAIFFRLIQNSFKLADKKILVYVIASITSLSTATLSVIFFAIVPFYLFNKKVSYRIVYASVLIPAIVMIFLNVEFLEKKIISEYNNRDIYVNYITDRRSDIESRSLGRFGSFLVDFMDFKKEPFVGYGNQKFERTMFSVGGVKLVRVNGLSNYMAKYGIIGLLFLFITLSMTFRYYEKIYKFKGGIWIVFGLLMINFGSALFFTPIYLMFQFFPFVGRSKSKNLKKYIK